MDSADALRAADRLVITGATPVVAMPIDVTDALYKVVPADSPIGTQSAYWMTADELRALQQNPAAIPDRLALPNGSASTRWDIYAIRPNEGAVVFTSQVAPARVTLQDGTVINRVGGGQQVIVPNRTLFSPPIKIGGL